MANANLFTQAYVHTYVLWLNEKCVMRTYVCSLRLKAKLTMNPDRETDDKAQGIVLFLFSFKGAVWKKQDHSFQSSVWVQIENIPFNFDIVLKSVVGMQ